MSYILTLKGVEHATYDTAYGLGEGTHTVPVGQTVQFKLVFTGGYTFSHWIMQTDYTNDGTIDAMAVVAGSTNPDTFMSTSPGRAFTLLPVEVPPEVVDPNPPPIPQDSLIEVYRGVNIMRSGVSNDYYFSISGSAWQYAVDVATARVMIDGILDSQSQADVLVETYMNVPIYYSPTHSWYFCLEFYGNQGISTPTIEALRAYIKSTIEGGAEPTPTPTPTQGASVLDKYIGFEDMPVAQRLIVAGGVAGFMFALLGRVFPKKKQLRELDD